jgi:DNA-binding transcriptional LysR family regulator
MDINDLLIFVRVAQAGSFSKAARALQMPVSTVSRRVATLEEHLRVPLLHRTTRSLKITDVGAAYFEHGKAIATEIEKAESLVTNLQSIPQGKLKITASTEFGNRFLGKIVSEYLKANTLVQVETVLTERVVDLIDEGFDLAIRIGELEDSTQLARKLGDFDMQLYASPSFLKTHGEPAACRELSSYECILFTGEDQGNQWHLYGPKGRKDQKGQQKGQNEKMSVEVKGRLSSNNMALIHDFALAGEGIALMPHFLCAEDLKAGRLKMVLQDWVYSSGPIHVVFPGQRFPLPKVRAFVDHLVRFCERIQWRHS